jgi:hypothetical protein
MRCPQFLTNLFDRDEYTSPSTHQLQTRCKNCILHKYDIGGGCGRKSCMPMLGGGCVERGRAAAPQKSENPHASLKKTFGKIFLRRIYNVVCKGDIAEQQLECFNGSWVGPRAAAPALHAA